jgi:hypothetical protein
VGSEQPGYDTSLLVTSIYNHKSGGLLMWICECGEPVEENTFKDYIDTSINPSTATIGHNNCGIIYNFIDGEMPKKYYTKKELKTLALKFIKKRTDDTHLIEKYLLFVDRLKSAGNLADAEILIKAFDELRALGQNAGK